MRDQTASKTALATAYIRAAHQLFDARPLLFDDPTALPLLGPGAAEVIRAHADRHHSPGGRALRSHVCLRSRFAEDCLARAVAQGEVDAYVLVGAGYDTFCLRRPAWAAGLPVVEVDHPSTQAAKRTLLAQAGLAEPADTRFVPADLSRESLGEVLARHGLGRDRRAYFAWLGVTMYLERAATAATLRDMAAFAPGSRVILTYRGHAGAERGGALAERVARAGEAFVACFSDREMDALLRASGFAETRFLTPGTAASGYFTPPRADLPAPETTTIVLAATGRDV